MLYTSWVALNLSFYVSLWWRTFARNVRSHIPHVSSACTPTFLYFDLLYNSVRFVLVRCALVIRFVMDVGRELFWENYISNIDLMWDDVSFSYKEKGTFNVKIMTGMCNVAILFQNYSTCMSTVHVMLNVQGASLVQSSDRGTACHAASHQVRS